MRNLHIIMPMAGEGSRFKQVGIDTPKPLIKANGVPFFVRALYGIKDRFDLDKVKVTCIVQKKHAINYHIDEEILKHIHANIVMLNKRTNGAVETCLAAKPYIDVNDAILILDCDLEWHCNEYTLAIDGLLHDNVNNVGGMLLSFNSNDSRYSYAEVKDGLVVRTAEKNAISNNALVGAYYFNTSSGFFNAAAELIEHNKLSDIKEYYVSLLYNYLIESHKNVKLYRVDSLYSFGTPEELTRYEQLNV